MAAAAAVMHRKANHLDQAALEMGHLLELEELVVIAAHMGLPEMAEDLLHLAQLILTAAELVLTMAGAVVKVDMKEIPNITVAVAVEEIKDPAVEEEED